MFLIKKVKGAIAAAIILASMGLGQAAMAQKAFPAPKGTEKVAEDFPNDKLQQFVKANERAFSVQQESEKAMMAVIQEEKISVEKFNEIAQAHQEQKLDGVKASEEEMAAFSKAAQRIVEMQPEVHQNLVKAIEQEGLTVQEFEKIMMAYQQNPAVQAKVQKLLEE